MKWLLTTNCCTLGECLPQHSSEKLQTEVHSWTVCRQGETGESLLYRMSSSNSAPYGSGMHVEEDVGKAVWARGVTQSADCEFKETVSSRHNRTGALRHLQRLTTYTRPAQPQARWGRSTEKREQKWVPVSNQEDICNWDLLAKENEFPLKESLGIGAVLQNRPCLQHKARSYLGEAFRLHFVLL